MRPPGERGLRVAAAIAVGVAVVSTVLSIEHNLDIEFLILAYAMTLLPTTFCVITIVGCRRYPNRARALKPQLLALSTILLAIAVAVLLLGYLGLFIDLFLVPIAVMQLLLAWVQPRAEDYVGTVLLGLALAPLVAWFLGRADEVLGEALVAGTAILLSSAALTVRRRRGQLANDRSTL